MTRPQRQVGGRVVTEMPDYGTPPPAPIEDAPAPIEDAPVEPEVEQEQGSLFDVVRDAGEGVFVPSRPYQNGAWGPETREAWRRAKERGTPSLLERLGIMRPRYDGVVPPFRFLPTALADMPGPSIASITSAVVHAAAPPMEILTMDDMLHARLVRQARDAEEARLRAQLVEDEETYTGSEMADPEALGPLPPRPVADLCDQEGHLWVEDRELCSLTVNRICTRCRAEDSYTDTIA